MNLIDELDADASRTGVICFMERMKAENPELHAQTLTALADPRYNAEAIARALRKMGVNIKGDSVRTHRRGECDRCLKTS